jgi:hypothetical protein
VRGTHTEPRRLLDRGDGRLFREVNRRGSRAFDAVRRRPPEAPCQAGGTKTPALRASGSPETPLGATGPEETPPAPRRGADVEVGAARM